uniref:TF-B3 domain-containing protein n=1 Tax=Leersia perrieri TaxID=77586 RepID=A0A0D9XQ23_9ORYZ
MGRSRKQEGERRSVKRSRKQEGERRSVKRSKNQEGERRGVKRSRRSRSEKEEQRNDALGMSFFRVILTEQSMEILRIPPPFNRYLQNQPTGMVSLVDRNDNTWIVELIYKSGEFFFVHGWKEFIRDNSIETGQFVVFNYAKQSEFSVTVFKLSGIENTLPNSARVSKKVIIKIESDDVDTDNAATNEERMAPPLKESNINTGKRIIDADSLMEDRAPLKKSSDANVAGSSKRKRGASVGKSKASPTSHNSTKGSSCDMSDEDSKLPKAQPILMQFQNGDIARRGLSKGQRQLAVISQRRPVTEGEKDHALQRAKDFKSKNPFAVQIMMESYVYVGFFMNIPCDFVREYLPRTSKMLTLWDPQGKSWKVNYVYYSDRSVGSFSGGWGKFAIGNNLEKFDVCVFELIQKDNIKVHIYRVVPEITPHKLRSDRIPLLLAMI